VQVGKDRAQAQIPLVALSASVLKRDTMCSSGLCKNGFAKTHKIDNFFFLYFFFVWLDVQTKKKKNSNCSNKKKNPS
jgi:hypothetical protein